MRTFLQKATRTRQANAFAASGDEYMFALKL
jgi:hypothetical protein